jgi:antitoxin CcdA
MTPKLSAATAAQIFDASAPKRPTNVSVNADLLRQARDLNINLSQALEERLIERILTERQRRWRDENKVAIEAYNRRVELEGVFGDDLRQF